ncbi:bacteriocin [Clostridium perfringens]|nr:bacteriocin [Clostridium perfringens]
MYVNCIYYLEELEKIDGGLIINIGALTITGTALAKGATVIVNAYMSGYTLGTHMKKKILNIIIF